MAGNFKKILLSLTFVVVFGLYVIYQKNTSGGANPVVDTLQTNPSQINNNQDIAMAPMSKKNKFKNGQYTGNSVDAFYGLVQVQAIIAGGKLTDIKFLDYPQVDDASLSRSNHALPILKSEAIQTQSANVNAVSGATETSRAFGESLCSALSQAI